MAIIKRIDGKTPNGGDYTEVYFQNIFGESVEEEVATKAEVVEYTTAGEQVWRTYMIFPPPLSLQGATTDDLEPRRPSP